MTLTANKASGSTCANLFCDWYVNGLPVGWGSPFPYTFTTPGSYQVDAACECSPCDVLGAGYIYVNVACSASVSISSPPNNPNPTDAAWQTNYTFLSTSTISGSAAATPSGYSSGIQWTIVPTIGGTQNLVPSNGMGPSISFRPSVIHPPYGQGGSLSQSPPLSYAMRAARCQSLTTNTITQDQRDKIRQEYVNHSITIPDRAAITTVVATAHFSVSEISQSAYTLIVTNAGTYSNPGALGEAGRTAYNTGLRTALANPNFPDQGIGMSSGWRNPERNEAIGSTQVASVHQYGGAADLQILSSTITASGLTSAQVWQILADAGDAVASGFCERGALQVACNDPLGVTHVHVQN